MSGNFIVNRPIRIIGGTRERNLWLKNSVRHNP